MNNNLGEKLHNVDKLSSSINTYFGVSLLFSMLEDGDVLALNSIGSKFYYPSSILEVVVLSFNIYHFEYFL